MQALQTSANVLFLLLGAILVLFMHAGFAFLELGTVRRKNQVNALVKILTDFSVATLAYYFVGYAIAYGVTFLSPAPQLNLDDGLALTRFFFLLTFAAAVPAIISGGIAERAKFYPQLLATAIIVGLVYPLYEGAMWGDRFGQCWHDRSSPPDRPARSLQRTRCDSTGDPESRQQTASIRMTPGSAPLVLRRPSRWFATTRSVRTQHQFDQGADVAVRLDRVAEREVAVHLVPITPALAHAGEITSLVQVGDDALHRTLGDPDSLRHLAQADLRVARDAEQHVGVIAQECPVASVFHCADFLNPLSLTPELLCDRRNTKSVS